MEIWKFTLSPDVERYEMPTGATLLTVQVQQGQPQLWAVVDPRAPKRERLICIYGTGWTLPEKLGAYVGTFQLKDQGLVFHVFDYGDQNTAEAFMDQPVSEAERETVARKHRARR